MLYFFAILGVLAFVGVVAGVVLYVMDLAPRHERHQVEQQLDDAAHRVHLHTRAVIGQLLDDARRQRGEL